MSMIPPAFTENASSSSRGDERELLFQLEHLLFPAQDDVAGVSRTAYLFRTTDCVTS